MKKAICRILSVIMLAVTAFLIYCAIIVTGSGFMDLSNIVRYVLTGMADTLSLEATGESVEGKEWLKGDPNGDGSSVVLDITDHAALEASQRRNETYSQLMKSWNSLMNQLKQESESGGYDYFKTIRLFRSRSAEWEKSLEQTDPAAYQVWLDKFKNVIN